MSTKKIRPHKSLRSVWLVSSRHSGEGRPTAAGGGASGNRRSHRDVDFRVRSFKEHIRRVDMINEKGKIRATLFASEVIYVAYRKYITVRFNV